jgi:hypothetical protein
MKFQQYEVSVIPLHVEHALATTFHGATFLGVRCTGALPSMTRGDALSLLVVFPGRRNHVPRDVSDNIGLVFRPVLALLPVANTNNNMPSTQTRRHRPAKTGRAEEDDFVDSLGKHVPFVFNVNVPAVRLYLPHIPRVALRTHKLGLHILLPPLLPVLEIRNFVPKYECHLLNCLLLRGLGNLL